MMQEFPLADAFPRVDIYDEVAVYGFRRQGIGLLHLPTQVFNHEGSFACCLRR